MESITYYHTTSWGEIYITPPEVLLACPAVLCKIYRLTEKFHVIILYVECVWFPQAEVLVTF